MLGRLLFRNLRQSTATFALVLCLVSPHPASAEDQPVGEKVKAMQEVKTHAHTNRLINATSPYLLQHAHNPVDWHEWGEEAFAKAVKEDKPIFLSIGYSACHWCHVMEHETFESEEVANYINDRFVCIKVDREERPDVDEIYMHVTQIMNRGHGGWPMSVFLTNKRQPIYAGTYYPRAQFLKICERIHEVWTSDRDSILKRGDEIQASIQEWAQGDAPQDDVISRDTVDQVAKTLASYFDKQKGGFRSDANKFPPSMSMELMLRVHRRTSDTSLLDAVNVTLQHMARGGISDHLGGGICRYSTDPDWLVPHFEKMLYDQALVSAIYLDAFQVTKDPLYESAARDIFDYVIRDLQSPEGGFYSTRDADSEGMEGAFYIWTVEQVKAVLGEERGTLFCEFYDVTEKGNWFESRGHAPAGAKNILQIKTPLEAFAKAHKLDAKELKQQLAKSRTALFAEREKRVHPALDDKILTGWNGLMI
ncbi:MAG: thioredoxin domain-containing protein, partial [Planctomycetes bacterium]|nr:thioredoxin domain-containing protein [Planctomycetota bacterium]